MAATPFKVKAVFDYPPGHEDDLSFSNGQIITVTDVEDEDWYYGEYVNAEGATKQGLFPKNFVERYEPVTPPRPSRTARREQEPEAVPEIPIQSSSVSMPQAAPKAVVPEPPSDEEDNAAESEPEAETVGTTAPPAIVSKDRSSETRDLPVQSPPESRNAPPPAAEPVARAVPPPPTSSKSPPPAVAEKPAASSFRDRIAAFNKTTAPPVAPLKPGQAQGSSFVKKPFVPPPPSRNAYVPIPKDVPPQKVFRREEEPNQPDSSNDDIFSSSAPAPTQEGEEEQPKPTSLKERIALLQKQQLEQAARHAEVASKKEKPKKPPLRKQPELSPEDDGETAAGESAEHALPDAEQEGQHRGSSEASRAPGSSKPRDHGQTASFDSLMNDPNDADQSAGGDTEDGEPSATTRRPPRAPTSVPRSAPPPVRQLSQDQTTHSVAEHQASDNEEEAEPSNAAEEGEEEEELDPEIRRRLEIRERMAKMSGGMGMAGMFGPPGMLPALGPRKTQYETGVVRQSEEEPTASPPPQPVPIMALPGMAMPGMTRKINPDQERGDASDDESAEEQSQPHKLSKHEESSDGEEEEESSSRPPPPPPTERPVPVPPTSRAAPSIPTTATTRAVPPPPPPDSRPLPQVPPPSSQFLSAGEDSDDELSGTQDGDVPDRVVDSVRTRRPPLPPIPGNALDTGSETAPISPTSPTGSPKVAKSSTFPQDTAAPSEKRISRAPPPIPGAAMSSISPPPASRAPPPPPPPTRDDNQALRRSTGDGSQDESEEVTEYEGDYDTDIAAGDSHKDALTADPSSSADETLTGDEASYHHSGLPSIGPPPGIPPVPAAFAPRGAPPPPPPREAPRPTRQSSDLPRPPPPPPPSQAPIKSRQSNDIPRGGPPPIPQQAASNDEDYDPYNYSSSSRPSIPNRPSQRSVERIATADDEGESYGSPPLRTARFPPPEPPTLAPPPPLTPQVSTSTTRQSLDTSRAGPARASMDGRPSMDTTTGYMAHEIDISRTSNWWTQRKMPPPSLQSRSDVAYEIEESTAIQQDGSELILKHVYILFIDYSQTILTVRFPQNDPSKAEFSQRYEAPPIPLRQDQLEAAHQRFGARIAEKAAQHLNHIVGNGSPRALITDLLQTLPDVIPAIGSRAFGAVVYANMANATVQQLDEIRPGDIISFRNTKLQGHKGPMKAKYALDVGKPDHVAVVLDWDGTKKKIRAWEQGRESKKVKVESFKLGDIKIGEVKIWRVVGREWVGWGSVSKS